MDKKKALALKNFVCEAQDVFDSIFDDSEKYSDLEIENLKQQFSEAEFDRHYDEFENELRANLLKYSNHIFIKAYLKSVFFDGSRYLELETEIASQIIMFDFQTEFLLKLFDCILTQFDNFRFFSQAYEDSYRPISEYLKELEEEEEDETHAGPKMSPEHKESFLTLLLDKIDSGVFVMEGMKGGEAKKAIVDAFGAFLGEDLAGFKKQLAAQKQKVNPINDTQSENKSKKNTIAKSFDKYLLHKDSLQLANALKTQFSTEKGKALRLLIETMKENNPPVLAIARGENNAFYEAMQLFFNRNIGTYPSIFDYVIKPGDTDVMDAMKTRLNFILEQIK